MRRHRPQRDNRLGCPDCWRFGESSITRRFQSKDLSSAAVITDVRWLHDKPLLRSVERHSLQPDPTLPMSSPESNPGRTTSLPADLVRSVILIRKSFSNFRICVENAFKRTELMGDYEYEMFFRKLENDPGRSWNDQNDNVPRVD
jgi:hypothetical protein